MALIGFPKVINPLNVINMTVQRITIKYLPGWDLIWNATALHAVTSIIMTLDPYGNPFKEGVELFFPRRFSKKFLKENRNINYSCLPFVTVNITNAKYSNPSSDYIEEWETIEQILECLKVNWKGIPVTCIPHKDYVKPSNK